MKFLVNYLLTMFIMLGLDGLWLGVVAREFNKRHLSHFLRDKFLILPALIFYLIYAAGLVFFVIHPGLENKSAERVILTGAFLGLLAYSTFDLTSLAAFKGWSIKLTVVDIFWGTFMSGLTAWLVFKLRS